VGTKLTGMGIQSKNIRIIHSGDTSICYYLVRMETVTILPTFQGTRHTKQCLVQPIIPLTLTEQLILRVYES
jgi:hypothetical protein